MKMDATLALAERNEELERVNRALLRKLADRDRRRMELEEVVYKAASDARKGIGPPRVEKPVRDRRAGREEVVCLHFTDWQDGKQTATYNMDVCERRVREAVRKTIRFTDIQRAAHPVRKAVVLLGGDMLEGITIFPGQAHEVEAAVFEQVFHCADLISSALLTMVGAYDTAQVQNPLRQARTQ